MSKLAKALTAAAGNAGESLYVEDIFSTYLYTGNGSTQTITNGIDLAGEGGLVWVKCRSIARDNILGDSERLGTSGGTRRLISNSAAAQSSTSITTFFLNSDGFATNGGDQDYNGSGETYASWTFRKAEKFFDVVTWTGDATAGRTVAHNLGSVPGVIIVKQTNDGNSWIVYHRSVGATGGLVLNGTNAVITTSGYWNNTSPTSTDFTLGGLTPVNQSGGSYVAYLFAHDAGGFGDNGSESIIKCGSYTGNGTTDGPEIDLGFEPQWTIIKRSSATGGNWMMHDNMRGVATGGDDQVMYCNSTSSESGASWIDYTSTGFKLTSSNAGTNASGSTYIYIAIRRPMKTPESGTEVFSPTAYTGNATYPRTIGTLNASDFTIVRDRTGAYWNLADRLRGGAVRLFSNATDAETTWTSSVFGQSGFTIGSVTNDNTVAYINYLFRRAPGFMDVVCFYATAGTSGSPTQTFSHNLSVTPELAISKTRGTANGWLVYHSALGVNKRLRLHSDGAEQVAQYFTGVSSTTFTIDNYNSGTPADNNVAYLFATCPGVSKVGSYTGTAADLNVDCGFSAGARFVLIKRTDSTGDWYVWDSARGIVAGNDPYLLINSTAAEVTSTDYIDPLSSGFTVTSSAPAALNASGGNYIFLAIA